MVKKCINIVKNNYTYFSPTLCAMLQQLSKSLSGESRSDNFEFLKGTKEVQRVQCGRVDSCRSISTPKEVL